MIRNRLSFVLAIFITCQPALALTPADVPAIYDNIIVEDCQPVAVDGDVKYYLHPGLARPDYTVEMLARDPKGTASGFEFTFKDPRASETLAGGTLFYSLWDPKEGRYPMPHYRFAAPIDR